MSTLYVSDLDGTLLNGEKRVGEETARILNGLIDRGLHFTVATARSFESAGPLLAGLRLKLPGIFINGVFVTDLSTGRAIQSHFIPRSFGEEVADAYLRAGLNPIVYTIDREGQSRVYYRGVFNRSESHYFGERKQEKDGRFRIVDDYSECLTEQLIAVNAIDVPERLETVRQAFEGREQCVCHYGPDIYVPDHHWLEISDARATKSQAARHLKESLGYDKLVCFGDNLNDLSMFGVADECYAVGNAHDLVKEAATKVIGSNVEEGVAKFLLERYS
ncbi:HAD family hydrolase [Cohnella suwonensis]|uniref:HAD family hydrolase n=1 Tax=Cohnella suwonensis TaxID=696072 RepID=A0ABW0LUU2_9BACL